MMRGLKMVLAVVALAGCEILPGSGPTTVGVRDDATVTYNPDKPEPYVVVGVNTRIAKSLAGGAADIREGELLPDTKPPHFHINEGDTVQVSLVSINENGYIDFATSSLAPISLTPLPPQVVADDGKINVPPLGRVQARGLSPETFEGRLEAQLSEVLVDPSVVVQILDRQTDRASVIGQVETPGSFAILRRDLRLLDLIGLSGGQTVPAEDLVLTLTRGTQRMRMSYIEALSNPAANIRIHAGDVVSVDLSRRSYVIRGAINVPGRYEFIEPQVTLAEAIGLARGIPDRRASRTGMFVFRTLERERLTKLGFDPSPLQGPMIPTVFHFNYRVPSTIFAEEAFVLEEGDVVYIGDSWVEELNKIFGVFTGIVPVQTFVPTPEF
ncbi:polysaccharide export protein [Rhodobacteraceae bacterium NNCM2]|nr:polysaccharide export protein [Coraliihabitans acroporae]